MSRRSRMGSEEQQQDEDDEHDNIDNTDTDNDDDSDDNGGGGGTSRGQSFGSSSMAIGAEGLERMLGQVGLLRGPAERDILRAAGDGQHRAARARQLPKDRGSVLQRPGGGPRAVGGRQGGARADSPVRVEA